MTHKLEEPLDNLIASARTSTARKVSNGPPMSSSACGDAWAAGQYDGITIPPIPWKRVFEWRAANIQAAKDSAADHMYRHNLSRAIFRAWEQSVGPPPLVDDSSSDYHQDNDDDEDDGSTDTDDSHDDDYMERFMDKFCTKRIVVKIPQDESFRKKDSKMRYRLAEAIRDRYRRFLLTSSSMTLTQDGSEGRQLYRFYARCCAADGDA